MWRCFSLAIAARYIPDDVNNVAGVQNIELDVLAAGATPYVICAEGQEAAYMFLDFSAPQGMWTRSPTTGKFYSHAVAFKIEFRIYGSGSAWNVRDFTAPYHLTPWRGTVRIALNGNHLPTTLPGRYEVRVYRLLPRLTEERTADKVFWTGLRGFIAGTTAPQTTRRRNQDQGQRPAWQSSVGAVLRRLSS